MYSMAACHAIAERSSQQASLSVKHLAAYLLCGAPYVAKICSQGIRLYQILADEVNKAQRAESYVNDRCVLRQPAAAATSSAARWLQQRWWVPA